MSDFEFDCMKKKQLAGQAKYRKRGSKSKKCSLPSDRMTRKQWKERCGPVMTYNPNKPMKWEDFKKLSYSIQAEYIAELQKKYGATAVDLGNMFGVRALTVRKHSDANNLGVEFPRGHAMSAAKKVEWEKFLYETTGDESVVEGDFVKSDEGTAGLALRPMEECVVAPPTKVTPGMMKMNSFNLHFSGTIDVGMIANSLRLILGEDPRGELEIICRLA